MSRYFLWASVLCVLVFGPACKGDCRKLAEKLCQCSANTSEKNLCIQNASTEQGRVGTTDADEAVCASLYNGCDCHTINTPAGKVACGLARPGPDGGVGGSG
jgi:hypothetical protein